MSEKKSTDKLLETAETVVGIVSRSGVITELSKMDGRVYVYLKNAETGEKFLNMAEDEGFTFCDGEKPTNRYYAEIMAVNKDSTVNYVGFVGRVAYGSGADKVGGEKLIKVDFAEVCRSK